MRVQWDSGNLSLPATAILPCISTATGCATSGPTQPTRSAGRGAGRVAVQVPEPRAVARAERIANRGLKPDLSVAQLREYGIAANGLTPQEKAALFRLEGEHGIEYWLGLHDFYVITRYNRSHMYALAVYQLSEEIKAGRDAEI